ncbi:vanadium-dependent haloperoxidase [uncultured Algibacter sp.]|uniref:vanadium-dependent haloperoxidase n=1 Tax=uncultured Algibacter sp. TaxID=298659 RepID=UPI0030EE4AAD|tara:strand:+ start:3456 stop:4811 length:1356 start_codon:yes stop_codon:yes gene_type:complete
MAYITKKNSFIKKIRILLICAGLLIISCNKINKIDIEVGADEYFGTMDKLTEIMVHDIFSPPVASRVYVYPNIGAYEILTQKNDSFISLSKKIKTLKPIPKIPKEVNAKVAALVAYIEISKTLIFSKDKITIYRDSLYTTWKALNKSQFNKSKTYGLKVAEHIKRWLYNDNYRETRTMPKYSIKVNDSSRWQPTPPSYMEGIEPHWNKIKTLALDSASQFKPMAHPKFSLDKKSDFYNELLEVYTISNGILKKGEHSEEKEIAKFWDCNPYVSVTRGHLMFATKKITPGAHWMGIAKIACKQSEYNFENTVYVMTKTAIGIFDAFISCWDEKYRSNLIRPETLINNHIDENWKPILQTPPFPEYTSGHSVVSGTASAILTSIFGDKFSFDDDTEVPYKLPIRSFSSFKEAAEEAAISRLYGGIHYKSAIDKGLSQGMHLGHYVIKRIDIKK